MAKLAVIYSESAQRELEGISDWNVKFYGRPHARSYVDFLMTSISALGVVPTLGRPLEARPSMHYLNIRRKARGYGHIAVYAVSDTEITVLHIFHDAQDWRSKLP